MTALGAWLDSDRARLVRERARAVPAGLVTTYGDLCPGAPRYAGAVLAACEEPDLPWQRIVRADGSLAKGDRQRRLLELEGVPFRGRRIDMRAAWTPIAGTPRLGGEGERQPGNPASQMPRGDKGGRKMPRSGE